MARAATAASAHGRAGLLALIDQLLAVDATGYAAPARDALQVLRDRPTLVARLDEFARPLWRTSAAHRPSIARVTGSLRDGTAGPIAVALASTHADGHIREAAVARMLHSPDPAWIPFLVLRTGDWVPPVREYARTGLVRLLSGEPERYLPAVLGMALVVRHRARGGFAYTQALAALLAAPAGVPDRLLATARPAERRFMLDLGLAQGWWSPDTLLTLAVTGPDVRIRSRVAEMVCRQAVWTCRVTTLKRLARHPGPEVRAQALTGLARLGYHPEVASYLDDPAPLIRAIARQAAERTGIDVLDHYRRAVGGARPDAGAVAGLGEAGGQRDAALLQNLLRHPEARIRAGALGALRLLDAVPVEQAVPLLRDPSPTVVREATAALRRRANAVPAELCWELLADPHRADVRRAGYRLLRVRGPLPHLRAALLLARDPDPRLARLAVADATRLARDCAGRARLLRPDLVASARQLSELADLTDAVAQALGPENTAMLRAWLARTLSIAHPSDYHQ